MSQPIFRGATILLAIAALCSLSLADYNNNNNNVNVNKSPVPLNIKLDPNFEKLHIEKLLVHLLELEKNSGLPETQLPQHVLRGPEVQRYNYLEAPLPQPEPGRILFAMPRVRYHSKPRHKYAANRRNGQSYKQANGKVNSSRHIVAN